MGLHEGPSPAAALVPRATRTEAPLAIPPCANGLFPGREIVPWPFQADNAGKPARKAPASPGPGDATPSSSRSGPRAHKGP